MFPRKYYASYIVISDFLGVVHPGAWVLMETYTSGSVLNWPHSHLYENKMRESAFVWMGGEAYWEN